MPQGVQNWSKTAASNNTADTSINWSEGQAASTVNDSARAMMARIAEYRDDTAGSLTTAGTSTAYTVTTNENFTTLALLDKQTITIVPHVTSGASPTLLVDSLTAKPMRASAGATPPTGIFVAGTPYRFVYYNAAGEFLLEGVIGDPTAQLQTGDMIFNPIGGTRTGWVRANGRTIGSATSGATELASATAAALYTFLYNGFSDTICPVTGGRGASAAADFAANKPIALLDYRFRTAFGVDDMGNSAAGRSTGATFGTGNATTAGSSGGEAAHTLITAELASHSHANSLNDPGHAHGYTAPSGAGGTFANGANIASASLTTTSSTTGITITNASAGSGNAHNTMPPFVLGTWYMKL